MNLPELLSFGLSFVFALYMVSIFGPVVLKKNTVMSHPNFYLFAMVSVVSLSSVGLTSVLISQSKRLY